MQLGGIALKKQKQNKCGCNVIDAPPTGQPASSLNGPPTTSTTPSHGFLSGTLLIVGVASGTSLVIINILIIGCCLHKRNSKQMKRGNNVNNNRQCFKVMCAQRKCERCWMCGDQVFTSNGICYDCITQNDITVKVTIVGKNSCW